MIDNTVATMGVVYPGVEKYLNDYFNTLNNQTYTYFDVWIINDGISNEILDLYQKKYHLLNIQIYSINENKSIAEIREVAINFLKNKYNQLIFADTDDYISNNRVESNLALLKDYDFCYNDMILVNEYKKQLSDKTYFRERNNPLLVDNFYDLLDKNFCGLSHTAINLERISLEEFFVPKNIIAVDWWLYTILVIKGYRGKFDPNSYTYYRQHDSNTVGGLNNINESQLLNNIKVKKIHYSDLLKYYPSHFDKEIKIELDKILKLEENIKDKNYLENYIDYVNNSPKEYMWWESAKLIEE